MMNIYFHQCVQTMNLFLDCEFNGFGGELISLALVDENERAFYEVLPYTTVVPWVSEHVIPKLQKSPIPFQDFQTQLHKFLFNYETIHIIADWPEDLSLFLNCLIIRSGVRMSTPQLSLEIWNEQLTKPVLSILPHNALQDALALMKNYTTYSSTHAL